MRRHLVTLIVATILIVGAQAATAIAQQTDLEQGVYVDQLTGFGVTWDPEVFTGSLGDIGGIRLDGLGSSGVLSTSSAPTSTECLARAQSTDPLGLPGWAEAPTTPELPEGSASEFGVKDGVVFRACIADPANPSGTTFIFLTLTGPDSVPDWDAAIAEWQSVIDAITFPDPALLTTIGINDGTYTDPLFGWSVQFDPARYEAQYAAGSADSPFLSGLYLYAEETSESGGIWAERHGSVDECLESQRAVNAELPEFGEAENLEPLVEVGEGVSASTWSFTLEPDGRFFVFAGCQPLIDGAGPVDGVFLVTTFTVPESGYANAVTAWNAMLQALTFQTGAPNGTPTS